MKRIFAWTMISFLILSFYACGRAKLLAGNIEKPRESLEGNSAALSEGTGKVSIGGEEYTKELPVEEGVDTRFIIESGHGVMKVVIPEGAVDATKLSVSAMKGMRKGYLSAGFYLKDELDPEKHVKLKSPAQIFYWQKGPLPENSFIFRYSDDLKDMIIVPGIQIKCGEFYGLMAEVDSLSGYGVGSCTEMELVDLSKIYREEQDKEKKKTEGKYFIWRLEAGRDNIRVVNPNPDVETMDICFYLRADTQAEKESYNNIYELPTRMKGQFYINHFYVLTKKAEFDGKEVPLVVAMNLADENLQLRLFPQFRRREITTSGGLVVVPLVDKPIITPIPLGSSGLLAVKEIEFDGYYIYGKASIVATRVKSFLGDCMDEIFVGQSWDVPIYARVRGLKATVTLSYATTGTTTLKGRFFGILQSESASAPNIKEPENDYSPDKPQNLPDKPADNPLEGLEEISISEDGIVSQQLGGGLCISILPPADEGEEEKKERASSLRDFYNVWNAATNIGQSEDDDDYDY